MYFGNTNLPVSGSLPAHHQELTTVQQALAHFMQVWWTLACRVRMELVPSGPHKIYYDARSYEHKISLSFTSIAKVQNELMYVW